MNSQSNAVPHTMRHAGPDLGVVATVFTVLKVASIAPVSIFGFTFGVPPPDCEGEERS